MTNKSKKSRKKHNKRQNKRSRKNRKGNENSININNTGLTEFIYKEGKQSPKKSTFKWNGKYNGQIAQVHMDFDVDGKKTHSDLKLSNQDLMNILGSTNVVDQPLDQRLQLLDKDLSGIYSNTPVFIHSGEMPMSEMPMSEMPINMSLEHEIFAIPMPSNKVLEHKITSRSKSGFKSKIKSK